MKITAFILALVMCAGLLFGCAKPDSDTPSDKKPNTNTQTTTTNEDNDTGKAPDPDNKGESSEADKESGTTADHGSGENPENTEGNGTENKDTNVSDTEKAESSSKDTQESSSSSPEKDEKPSEETKKPSSGTSDPNVKYSDGMILEAYLSMLSSDFYKSYAEGDSLKDRDILHLTAYFLLYQRASKIGTPDGDDKFFSVSASVLEENMILLFGDKASLSQQKKFLDEKAGDKIEGDTYIFPRQRSSSADEDYYLSYEDKMEIKETDDKLTAKVTLKKEGSKSVVITYTFKKVVSDDYLYFRLVKAKVG